jgi:tetratricopeptide (TPR) repeat protein
LILSQIKPTESDEKGYASLYYTELGNTYDEMGDYKEAIKWYEKVIELKPDQTNGYIFKGACLAAAGEYELAKEEHLKATKLKGHPEEAYYNLALICRAEMNFEQAKAYCKKSLKIDPNDASVKHCYEDIKKAIRLKNKDGG